MSSVRTLQEGTAQKSTKKPRKFYNTSRKRRGPTHNTTRKEWEAIKTLREDPSHVVLTADKGVALVVMDKSQYIDKCMALLSDTRSTNLERTLPRNSTETSRNPFEGLTENTELQNYMIGANSTTQIAPYR